MTFTRAWESAYAKNHPTQNKELTLLVEAYYPENKALISINKRLGHPIVDSEDKAQEFSYVVKE